MRNATEFIKVRSVTEYIELSLSSHMLKAQSFHNDRDSDEAFNYYLFAIKKNTKSLLIH